MAAIIDSMVLTTSLETSFTPARACSASVLTAASTSSRARSVWGLNSFFSSEVNSLASMVAPSAACACSFASAMALLALSAFGLRGGGQRLEQRRVLEDLGHQLFGAALAVHVR